MSKHKKAQSTDPNQGISPRKAVLVMTDHQQKKRKKKLLASFIRLTKMTYNPAETSHLSM